MRRAARIDENQPAIVSVLEFAGASVVPTGGVHDGFPDLLVGLFGVTYLLEIKNPKKPKTDQRLTPAQVEWHANWRGNPVSVVRSETEALEAIGWSHEQACHIYADFIKPKEKKEKTDA